MKDQDTVSECEECLRTSNAKVVHQAKFPHHVTLTLPLRDVPSIEAPIPIDLWVDVVVSISNDPMSAVHRDIFRQTENSGVCDMTDRITPKDWKRIENDIRELVRRKLGAIYKPVRPDGDGCVPPENITKA